MSDTVKSFCERLNIAYDERLEIFYQKGAALYNEKGSFVFDKARLASFNNKYNIFRKWFDTVLAAADAVKQDADLILFVYTLASIIKEKEDVKMLGIPDRECLATDFAPLFSLFYFLEDMVSEMEKRNLPYDVISDTLNGFETEIDDYLGRFGRPGMRIYVSWFLIFVRGEILRIGRLQFQIYKSKQKVRVYKKGDDVKILMDGEYMHKKGMVFGSANQDDEDGKYFAQITENDCCVTGYAANEYGECDVTPVTLCGYDQVLRVGDYVLSVHIPSDGPLDYDECEKSYSAALDIFRNNYPEYDFKAFVCYSWLLEKRLKDIMGKDTNITRFADKYIGHPMLSKANGVYGFLYSLPEPVPACELPEKTSMHRLVKKYLLEGNAFYEKGGVILI